MKNTTETSALSLLANDAGYDPLEDRLRENIRSTIEAVFEEELAQFLGRCRYGREDALRQGYRNGHRERQLTGTFGTERVSVPRARIVEEDGRASEWRSRALPRYQRLTRKAEALIASVYLSGTNTRRVKRALFGLFRGAVSKDVVSRAWRKVKVDWDAWCSRGLADEDIVRLILDGTVIKTRLDRKATNISVLAAIGVRRDGQKVLLSIGNMGGESALDKPGGVSVLRPIFPLLEYRENAADKRQRPVALYGRPLGDGALDIGAGDIGDLETAESGPHGALCLRPVVVHGVVGQPALVDPARRILADESVKPIVDGRRVKRGASVAHRVSAVHANPGQLARGPSPRFL